MNNHVLIIFGGYTGKEYLGDLHVIDTLTGVVSFIETTGQIPAPRSTPVVAVYNEQFFVWGGFNGVFPTELSVLRLRTLDWETIHQPHIQGRSAVASAVSVDKMFLFGGSKQGGLVVINFTDKTVTTAMTIGVEPPSAVLGAGMVAVDHFLFFFGGKSTSSKWSLVYCCDLNKMWWFVFHVRPDGETLTIQDGEVSELGLFRIPRMNGFSIAYEEKRRDLLFFLGHPESNPVRINSIRIGEAVSFIHLREEMSSMMRLGRKMPKPF